MSVSKIVITGGPCGGKTSAVDRIISEFSSMGYAVLVVAETATELFNGGMRPLFTQKCLDYEICQTKLQLAKEEIYELAAEKFPSEKVLIVCDRGAIDNKAYMTAEEFGRVLAATCRNEIELRDSYDAVFHLVTAADGAVDFYTTANNTARTEDIDAAIARDRSIIAAWTGHPHLRVIDNSTDFDGKCDRLITEIKAFLGEPEPLEIEKKFLIEYPDTAYLESLPECGKNEIVQTYLKTTDGSAARVRKRGLNGNYSYYHTVKKDLTPEKRIEIEDRITEAEYNDLLKTADPARTPIEKTRYCLVCNSKYFEIDVYPFWKQKAVLEIELTSPDEPFTLPPFIKVIKDVTGDRNYTNAALAANHNL